MLMILEAAEFHASCEQSAATLKAMYQGTEFRRGPSFAMALYQKAVDFSERYLSSGAVCLLVKDQMHCTVWVQSA